MTAEYWKKRCELAEKYIEESLSDPDIHKGQNIAYNDWMGFKKFLIPDIINLACKREQDCNIMCPNKLEDCPGYKLF